MGAPKGNEFWKLRSKHGRDKLFKTPELLWEAACEYFAWCDENPFKEEDFISAGPRGGEIIKLNRMRPYTLHGLCIYLDCNTSYFKNFKAQLNPDKEKLYKDFSAVLTRIEEVIYNQKFSGAAAGFLNANIIARDLGLMDKQEVKHDGGINIKIVRA
jgi:hypothetical protein